MKQICQTNGKTAIGLLTPYSGCNLGDGAIQDAVIEHIRLRRPDASLYLFTTDTKQTEKLHGVKSLPLTGLYIPGYSMSLLHSHLDDTEAQSPPGNIRSHYSSYIRSSPWLYRCLRWPYKLCKAVVRTIPVTVGEICHIIRSIRLMKHFDALVISGGGQLDEYWGGSMAHPYALFKWALIAKATHTKMFFISVGVGQTESRLSRFFIRKALEHADYRSYRDLDSKKLLGHWQMTHPDPVYPDLAFSYCPVNLRNQSRDSTGIGRVGVSPIAYLSSRGWPEKDAARFERYLETLVAFTAGLLKIGQNVVLFSTDSPDQPVVDELYDRVVKLCGPSAAGRLSRTNVTSVAQLFECLGTVDMVVASRLHGIILSHLAGIPAIAVSYDRKVNTYMREVDQLGRCIDISSITEVGLFNLFFNLRENEAEARAMIRRHSNVFRNILDGQYNHLFGAPEPSFPEPVMAARPAACSVEQTPIENSP